MKDYTNFISTDKDNFIIKYNIKDYSIIITYANGFKRKIRYTKQNKINLDNIIYNEYEKLNKYNIDKYLKKDLNKSIKEFILSIFITFLVLGINISSINIFGIISIILLDLYNIKNIIENNNLIKDYKKYILYNRINSLNLNYLTNDFELNKDLKDKLRYKTYKDINNRLKNKEKILDINYINKMYLFELKNILIYLKESYDLNKKTDYVSIAEDIIKSYKKENL